MLTVAGTSQGSSDYYGDEDSQFLEALGTAVLPGDITEEHEARTKSEKSESSQELEPPPSTQPSLKRKWEDVEDDQHIKRDHVEVQDDTYGATRFGDFGDYMRKKRAKLQIQNSEIGQEGAKSDIFTGISIYVSCIGSLHNNILTFDR